MTKRHEVSGNHTNREFCQRQKPAIAEELSCNLKHISAEIHFQKGVGGLGWTGPFGLGRTPTTTGVGEGEGGLIPKSDVVWRYGSLDSTKVLCGDLITYQT